MIVKDDRGELDACLADVTTVVLLVRGAENASPARAVYDFFVDDPTVWDPWHRCALITGLSPLTVAEKQNWFNGSSSNYYAVLANPDQHSPKRRIAHGRVTDLLTDGQPDLFKILDALQAGS